MKTYMEMDIGLKGRKPFSFIAFNLLTSIKLISKRDARGCLKEIHFLLTTVVTVFYSYL